jgi:hypothetical protein
VKTARESTWVVVLATATEAEVTFPEVRQSCWVAALTVPLMGPVEEKVAFR